MTKKSDRLAKIYGCFDGLCDSYPDKSTSFLLQMTADTMKCSYGDALASLEAHANSSSVATTDVSSLSTERNDG